VVVKLGKHNIGLDHLSRVESREVGHGLDDSLLNEKLFRVEAVLDQLDNIAEYLTIGQPFFGYTQTKRRQLMTRSVDYQLIARNL
jgi:hypothetical protein